jgi:hypothetical protein
VTGITNRLSAALLRPVTNSSTVEFIS